MNKHLQLVTTKPTYVKYQSCSFISLLYKVIEVVCGVLLRDNAQCLHTERWLFSVCLRVQSFKITVARRRRRCQTSNIKYCTCNTTNHVNIQLHTPLPMQTIQCQEYRKTNFLISNSLEFNLDPVDFHRAVDWYIKCTVYAHIVCFDKESALLRLCFLLGKLLNRCLIRIHST